MRDANYEKMMIKTVSYAYNCNINLKFLVIQALLITLQSL